MADPICEISRCGFCRFYNHEGHRGGHCSQLSVPVDSQWKSCCLALPPFSREESHSAGISGEMTEWVASSAVSVSNLTTRAIAAGSLQPVISS